MFEEFAININYNKSLSDFLTRNPSNPKLLKIFENSLSEQQAAAT